MDKDSKPTGIMEVAMSTTSLQKVSGVLEYQASDVEDFILPSQAISTQNFGAY